MQRQSSRCRQFHMKFLIIVANLITVPVCFFIHENYEVTKQEKHVNGGHCSADTAFEVNSLETQAGFGYMSSCLHYDWSTSAF